MQDQQSQPPQSQLPQQSASQQQSQPLQASPQPELSPSGVCFLPFMDAPGNPLLSARFCSAASGNMPETIDRNVVATAPANIRLTPRLMHSR